jgi:hypothetical protein
VGSVTAAAWAPSSAAEPQGALAPSAPSAEGLDGGCGGANPLRRVVVLSFARGGGGGGHLVALHFVKEPPSLVRSCTQPSLDIADVAAHSPHWT